MLSFLPDLIGMTLSLPYSTGQFLGSISLRLRLLLLVVLFLLVASAMASFASHAIAAWLRYAAAMVSIVGLVPLANEVYARYGSLGMTFLGLGGLILLLSLWGVLTGTLDVTTIVPTLQQQWRTPES